MENHNQQHPAAPTQAPSSFPLSYQSQTQLPNTPYQHLFQPQQHQLQMFWAYQRQEMESVNDFKNNQLPLARIKKIMKAHENVRMVSAEAPILFSKACELFILELTIRSWLHAEDSKRRTLQKNDIAAAISRTDIFDFLVDIIPQDDEVLRGGAMDTVGPVAGGVPYYHRTPGVTIGGPGGGVDPSVYVQSHPPSQAWQSMWLQQQAAEDGNTNLDAQG